MQSLYFNFSEINIEEIQRSWEIYFQLQWELQTTCTNFHTIWQFAGNLKAYIHIIYRDYLSAIFFFFSNLSADISKNIPRSDTYKTDLLGTESWVNLWVVSIDWGSCTGFSLLGESPQQPKICSCPHLEPPSPSRLFAVNFYCLPTKSQSPSTKISQ